MKKFFTLLLCVIYFVVSNGLTINKHYCGGKLVSVKIGLVDSHKCACGSNAMKKNCCQNQSLFIKSNSVQHLTKISVVDFSIKDFLKINQPSNFTNTPNFAVQYFNTYAYIGDFTLKERPSFILYQSLII